MIYEQLDDDDRDVLLLLGYTVGRAQLLEYALLKLLEAQRFDLDADPDERWHEILHWLTKYTARRAANKLRVPEEMATDLRRLVAGRDFLVHHSYRFYLSAHGTRGDEVVREYLEWFHGLSAALGYGYNGLMSIVAALQESANSKLDDDVLMRLWARARLRTRARLHPTGPTARAGRIHLTRTAETREHTAWPSSGPNAAAGFRTAMRRARLREPAIRGCKRVPS